jgi:hypothetical protein
MEPFARQLWRRLETIHAVTYFAPESLAAAQDLGVRGFWRIVLRIPGRAARAVHRPGGDSSIFGVCALDGDAGSAADLGAG